MKRKAEKSVFSTMGTLKLSRRSFVRNLTVLGGAAAAYSSPKVGAAARMLSEAQTLGSTGMMFDVQLPANYNINVPSTLLTVQLSTGQKANVDFNVKGAVVLNKGATAETARAVATSVKLTSNQSEPLAPLGLKTGPIVAEVPASTLLGTLNLRNGAFQAASIPVKVSLPNYRASNSGKNPAQTKAVQKVATQAASGDKCVIRDVNINVSMAKTTAASATQSTDLVPPTTTTGTLSLGFGPAR